MILTRYPIVIVFDRAFNEYMLTLVYNLYNNSHKKSKLMFYLVTENDNEMKYERLYLMSLSLDFEIIQVDANLINSRFKSFVPHISSATYYKLLILDVIDSQDEFLLVMDVDIYNIEDIVNVFEYRSEDYSISSVKNPSNNKYFGAGFFIINVKLAKTKYNLNNFYKTYLENIENIKWDEQDLLNLVFSDDSIQNIPYSWDFPVQSYIINKKGYHDKGYYLNLLKSIHYPGTSKPWRYSTVLPFVKEWRDMYFKIYGRKAWDKITSKELLLRILYTIFPNPSILFKIQRTIKSIQNR